MKSIARNLLHDVADAEDAVQEAFLKIYRGAKTFRGGAAFSTWAYRVLVNKAPLRRPASPRQPSSRTVARRRRRDASRRPGRCRPSAAPGARDGRRAAQSEAPRRLPPLRGRGLQPRGDLAHPRDPGGDFEDVLSSARRRSSSAGSPRRRRRGWRGHERELPPARRGARERGRDGARSGATPRRRLRALHRAAERFRRDLRGGARPPEGVGQPRALAAHPRVARAGGIRSEGAGGGRAGSAPRFGVARVAADRGDRDALPRLVRRAPGLPAEPRRPADLRRTAAAEGPAPDRPRSRRRRAQ